MISHLSLKNLLINKDFLIKKIKTNLNFSNLLISKCLGFKREIITTKIYKEHALRKI